MTDQYRDQKNSVQRGDLPMLATGGGAALFLIPAYDQMGPYRPAPYDLPPDLAALTSEPAFQPYKNHTSPFLEL